MDNKRVMLIQRIVIGSFAFLLPLLLWLLVGIQKSISYTYHTSARDIFTTIICSTGLVLISYIGYDIKEFILTCIAGIFGILLALFPCYSVVTPIGFMQISNILSGWLHTGFAFSFFTLLSYICIFQFTKGSNKIANTIYIICGVIMIVSEMCILIFAIFKMDVSIWAPESIALKAFGVAWLIKGKLILK